MGFSSFSSTCLQFFVVCFSKKKLDFFNGSAKKSTDTNDNSRRSNGDLQSALENNNRSSKVTTSSVAIPSDNSDQVTPDEATGGAHQHAEKDKSTPTKTLPNGTAEEGKSSGESEGTAGDQLKTVGDSPTATVVVGSVLAIDGFVMDESFITHL